MKNFLLYSIVAIGLCSCASMDLENANKLEWYAWKNKSSSTIKETYLELAQKYENIGVYDGFDYRSKAAVYYEKAGIITKAKEQCVKVADTQKSEQSKQNKISLYGGSKAVCDALNGSFEYPAEYYGEICLEKDRIYYDDNLVECNKSVEFYEKSNNIAKADEITMHISKMYFSDVKFNYYSDDFYELRTTLAGAMYRCDSLSNKTNIKKCYMMGIDILKPYCSKDSKKKAQICSFVGELFYKQKDNKNAFYYFDIAYDNDITSNLKEYKELLKQKCSAKDYNSCHRLAWIYEHEYPANYKEAISLYTKSCDANYYLSCNNLGVLHQDSNAFKLIDNKKSLELYTKACKGGEMIACSNIGGMYEQGKAVARNYNTAKSYYKKACNGGYKKACDFYNNLEANVVNVDSSDYSSRF